MKIQKLHSRQILDSRGNPTVETDVILENGVMGRASVPSGASVGTNEAVELRDNNLKLFGGKGVLRAVSNVNEKLNSELKGWEVEDQQGLDARMIEIDGTKNKSNLGANAILSVSLAAAWAAATNSNQPLYQYLGFLAGNDNFLLPMPMINIINGGAHADFATDIQEFMIVPLGANSFSHAIQIGTKIFHELAKVLKQEGYPTTVGDEGGYALTTTRKDWNGNEEALELIKEAIQNSEFQFGKDVALALDVAASELFSNGIYTLKTNNWQLDSTGMIDALVKYCNKYPVISIEDGLAQSDWEGWTKLTSTLGSSIQLVGDDLFVTNIRFLKRGIAGKCANSILVKVNQIGTLSETIETVRMAKEASWKVIISHRSGETEDVTIAHMAVGLATGQIKTGSLSRTDRVAKYNELLRIEEKLGEKALFAEKSKFLK